MQYFLLLFIKWKHIFFSQACNMLLYYISLHYINLLHLTPTIVVFYYAVLFASMQYFILHLVSMKMPSAFETTLDVRSFVKLVWLMTKIKLFSRECTETKCLTYVRFVTYALCDLSAHKLFDGFFLPHVIPADICIQLFISFMRTSLLSSKPISRNETLIHKYDLFDDSEF